MSTSSRLEVIDQYRGFATIMMVLANYANSVERVPGWLRHAPDAGLTVFDLGAPIFIFAIGLTHGLSVRRRIDRDGWGKTVEHFLRRYMALFGIGALIAYGQILVGQNPTAISWNVLQTIAVAGVLTLPLIRLPSITRAIAGIGILALYQVLLDYWWLEEVMRSSHGGLLGSLGWTGMLVLSTVMADLFHARRLRRAYPWAILLMIAVALALSLLIPISKNRISVTYALITIGTSGLIFWVFHGLVDKLGYRLALFTAWGRNPLLLYLLHNLLLAVFVLPGIPAWYPETQIWLMLLQMTALAGVLSWIANALYRRDWCFSL